MLREGPRPPSLFLFPFPSAWSPSAVQHVKCGRTVSCLGSHSLLCSTPPLPKKALSSAQPAVGPQLPPHHHPRVVVPVREIKVSVDSSLSPVCCLLAPGSGVGEGHKWLFSRCLSSTTCAEHLRCLLNYYRCWASVLELLGSQNLSITRQTKACQ